MNFLNSTILFFSALAVIPILIHLFNRQRVKRIEFSSIKYLKSLQKTRMRRLKIKQLLLLILRTLIILAIVVAFARPTTEGSYSRALGSAAPASVVILIDNSMSMSTETIEGTLFTLAKNQALGIVENLSAADQVAVIAFNNAPQDLTNGFTTNHSFVSETIKSIESTRIGTNPQTAVETALQLLESSDNLVKEIYLLSDLAGTDWQNLHIADIPENSRIKMYVSRLTKPDYENLKVVNINFGNSLIYPNRPVTVSAEVVNESARRVDNLLVSLYVNDQRISQTDLSLSARSSENVNFTNTFSKPGEHYGYIELTEDDLLEDNRWYFTISIPNRIQVLTLTENDNDDQYLRLAFKPLQDSPSNVDLTTQPISRLASLDLFQYDLLIINTSTVISPADISKLTSYVKAGGSLLLFIANDQNKTLLNEKIIQPAFGAQIVKPFTVKPGEGFFRLSSLDYAHPIFSRFGEIEKNYLPQVDFFNLVELSKPGTGKILASFSTGTPAIVENNWGSGRIMVIMSSLKPEDSDLVKHPFFVTLINRTSEYLAYDLNRLRENYLTGEKINKTLLNVNPEKSVEIIAPDQSKIYPAYNFAGSELNLTIPEIDYNGIAQLVIDDSAVESFAVNYSPQETDGRFLEISELKDILSGIEIIQLDNEAGFAKVIQESRLGKELSKIFFIIALILLAAEMLVARSGSDTSEESAN